ncbi:hypothetical protein [Belnapia sp. F-4-1]|uniref:hypothetical protein n=1 Tax=Belnapia sp. F-4-1 TaxID=1545443 RepID=UPI0005BD3078|nr:hypothetical protein [Belnapia sp. F-4-1]
MSASTTSLAVPGIQGGAAALLVGATLALALLQAWPKPGRPVALLFPPGLAATDALLAVLAEPGWDLIGVASAGPFALVLAAPDTAAAATGTLRRPAGAWAALHLPGGMPCGARP